MYGTIQNISMPFVPDTGHPKFSAPGNQSTNCVVFLDNGTTVEVDLKDLIAPTNKPIDFTLTMPTFAYTTCLPTNRKEFAN